MSICFVYLVREFDGWIKIGISKDPYSRSDQLAACLVRTWKFKARTDAYAVEQGAHSILNGGDAGCERFQTTIAAGTSAVRQSRAAFRRGEVLWIPRCLRHRRYDGMPAPPEEIQRFMGLPFLPAPIPEHAVIDRYRRKENENENV